MIPEITQKNVRLFIPYKVSKICNYICINEHISAQQAVAQFYKSKTAQLLGEEKTKLWQLGWVALYEMYEDEKHGK